MRGQCMGLKYPWSKVVVKTAGDPAVQKFAMLHDPSREVKGMETLHCVLPVDLHAKRLREQEACVAVYELY
jgi:hypothetical protein